MTHTIRNSRFEQHHFVYFSHFPLANVQRRIAVRDQEVVCACVSVRFLTHRRKLEGWVTIYTVRQLYNETEVIEQNWNKRLEYYLYFIQSTSLLHRYSEWHDLAKTATTSARLLVAWPEESMSQLLGCLEHLQRGALSMVTSVWGTENNHRGTNQGSRADDWARTLVFGLKILLQQLPGELVHCHEEETKCLVLSTRAGHGESFSIGVPEHSIKNFQWQFVPQGQTIGE